MSSRIKALRSILKEDPVERVFLNSYAEMGTEDEDSQGVQSDCVGVNGFVKKKGFVG